MPILHQNLTCCHTIFWQNVYNKLHSHAGCYRCCTRDGRATGYCWAVLGITVTWVGTDPSTVLHSRCAFRKIPLKEPPEKAQRPLPQPVTCDLLLPAVPIRPKVERAAVCPAWE